MPHTDELLQCFDQDGQPIEARPRSEIKQNPPRYRYGVARIWVVNDQGQILCSKRGLQVSNPLTWQTYFGGHVPAGKTIKETAVIELEEESGIKVKLEDLHLIDKGYLPQKMVFFESYSVKFKGSDADFKPCDREIEEVKWMSIDEYEQNRSVFPNNWSGVCTSENKRAILQWLQKNEA